MAPRKPAVPETVYQLKVSLKGIRPPIWRRIQVLGSTTLQELHFIVQAVMGWANAHLHQFTIDGIDYGQPVPDPIPGLDSDIRNENTVTLAQVVTGEKFKFLYVYDFGDDWEHEILVEKVLPLDPKVSYPVCLKGKRACPPEDCGGPWGYADFLAAIQDPSHPEHEEMLEWIDGSFDPEAFDLDQSNQQLAAFR